MLSGAAKVAMTANTYRPRHQRTMQEDVLVAMVENLYRRAKEGLKAEAKPEPEPAKPRARVPSLPRRKANAAP